MSDFSTRLVMMVTAGEQRKANEACAGLGFGPNSFSAPLGADGEADVKKATHFGCSWAMRPEDEARVLEALAGAGVTPAREKLEDRDPAESRACLDGLLARNGLQRVKPAKVNHGANLD